MLHQEFLHEMEDILEASPGSLTGGEALDDCVAWDSLAILSFTLLAQEKAGCEVPARAAREAQTVDDLYRLVERVRAEG